MECGVYCDVCGKDIDSGYFHPLKDKIWRMANHGKENGALCIACIQNNLGRDLRKEDFADQVSYIKLKQKGFIHE